MSTSFLIYGLLDPIDDELRYIGLTKHGIKRRMQDHLWEAKKGRVTHLYNWMRSLNSPPKIVILRECSSLTELLEAEIELIAHHRSIGCRLTNITKGGQGRTFNHTDETKKKISLSKMGKSGANKGKKFDILSRKNMKEASLKKKNCIGRIIDQHGFIYKNPEEASIKLKLKKSSLYQSIRDGRRLYGYSFRRMEV